MSIQATRDGKTYTARGSFAAAETRDELIARSVTFEPLSYQSKVTVGHVASFLKSYFKLTEYSEGISALYRSKERKGFIVAELPSVQHVDKLEEEFSSGLFLNVPIEGVETLQRVRFRVAAYRKRSSIVKLYGVPRGTTHEEVFDAVKGLGEVEVIDRPTINGVESEVVEVTLLPHQGTDLRKAQQSLLTLIYGEETTEISINCLNAPPYCNLCEKEGHSRGNCKTLLKGKTKRDPGDPWGLKNSTDTQSAPENATPAWQKAEKKKKKPEPSTSTDPVLSAASMPALTPMPLSAIAEEELEPATTVINTPEKPHPMDETPSQKRPHESPEATTSSAQLKKKKDAPALETDQETPRDLFLKGYKENKKHRIPVQFLNSKADIAKEKGLLLPCSTCNGEHEGTKKHRVCLSCPFFPTVICRDAKHTCPKANEEELISFLDKMLPLTASQDFEQLGQLMAAKCHTCDKPVNHTCKDGQFYFPDARGYWIDKEKEIPKNLEDHS